MSRNQIILLVVAAIAVALFFVFDLHHVVTLENAQAQREIFLSFYLKNPVTVILGFALVYIAVTRFIATWCSHFNSDSWCYIRFMDWSGPSFVCQFDWRIASLLARALFIFET